MRAKQDVLNLRSRFSKYGKWIGYIAVVISLAGCIPTIEKTYKAPEAYGVLVYFSPHTEDQFVPIVGAKIYHQNYPETVVYSDDHGEFLLPTVVKVEAKLLMVGHALKNYSIVIEKDSRRDIVLARADAHMRYRENIDLGSIVMTQPADKNAQDSNLDVKSQWPCDLQLIQSLDQAVVTAQRMSAAFQDRALDSDTAGYVMEHYQQLRELSREARSSCRWREKSYAEQRDYIAQTREYFSGVKRVLDNSFVEFLRP